MAYLVHVANVMYFASYSVRDILWLRVFTIIGMCICLPYFALREVPDWPPFFWHVVFVIVNVIQVALLIRERMPVQLDEREKRLHRGPFRMLSPQQVRKIVAQGMWQTVEPESQIVAENQRLDRLILLHEGTADVRTGEKTIAKVAGGQFVGEMSFLTGDPTSAEVVATEPVQYLMWPQGSIEQRELGTELFQAFQSALGIDLVNKLKDMR